MNRNWKLAILTRAVYPLHGYGGLERHVYDLLRHLLGTRRVFINLICPPPSKRPLTLGSPEHLEVLRDPGLRMRHVPYRTFPLAGRRFTTVLDRSTAYPRFGERAGRLAAQLVAAGEVELVYGLGASALGYARRRLDEKRRPGAPLVLNPQGMEEFGSTNPEYAGLKRFFYRPLQAAVRTCARAADRVIATDRSLQPVLEHHLQVPRSLIRVVPNAVDVERGDRLARSADIPSLRARIGAEGDQAILLSTGRIEESKGFHVLIDALSRIATDATVPAWRWVLVGDGPYRPRLEKLVDAAGLRARITLTGRVSETDLHTWYKAASIFVHPTLYEGSSLVTLEAMAHRRAIVATRAGGLTDKVVAGVNGWLVAPGDPAALAETVEAALRTPAETLAAMGQESRLLAERHFSWPAIVNQFLAVCEELLEEA